jgi:ankyrin repeat protein
VRTKVVSAFRRTVILGLALMISAPVVAQNKDLRVLDAVKRRDQKAFASLIRAKADLNAAQPDGATALAWAVHLGQRQMAEALLDAGANANTIDEYGETPLTLAAANGDGVLVQRLLKAGAKANATRWNGETALMIAAGAGSVDAVRQLVLHGADVNAADPRRGQTALMWAAAEGHSDVVSALVEIGANPKAASKGGFTPLVFAITENNVPSIDKLIAAGADPNYTLPSGNKPLLVAMAYRHTEATLALLERGADITARDRAGNSPLHLAAQVGNVAVVKALLAKGADANARTPRSTMAASGRGGGGGFRGGPSGEQTPLMLAARGDHLETMKALIAGGADPSLKAQDGTNLLMAAASGGRLPTVKYAYELDPHVDVVTTGTGNTIMHVAVGLAGRTQPEVVEVMQFLADRGAKLDEMNAANRTPIALADGLPVDLAVDLLTKLIAESGNKPKIPSKR